MLALNYCSTHYSRLHYTGDAKPELPVIGDRPPPILLLDEVGEYAQISLNKGFVAFVDRVDLDLVTPFTWRVVQSPRGKTHYAATSSEVGTKNPTMHRLIMGAENPMDIDHADRNGLNNRRHNLRFATWSQNSANRAKYGGVSKYKGVVFRKARKHWVAQIRQGGKRIHLGSSHSEEEAARRYDESAFQYWGSFAHLNFPRQAAK